MRGKLLTQLGVAAAVLALGATLSVPAQTTSKSVAVSRDATVGEVVLQKGKYEVRFDSGSGGEAVFSRSGREVSRAAYTLVRLERPAPVTVVVFSGGDNGVLRIKRIELKGSENAIEFQ